MTALTTAGTGMVTLAATQASAADDVIMIGPTYPYSVNLLRQEILKSCYADPSNCTLSGSVTDEWVAPTKSHAFLGGPVLLEPVNGQYPIQTNCTSSQTSFRYQTQYTRGTQSEKGGNGNFEIDLKVIKIGGEGGGTKTEVEETTTFINMEVPVKPGETGFAMHIFPQVEYTGWLWYHRLKDTSPDVRVWVDFIKTVPDGTDGVNGRNVPVSRPQTADEAAGCKLAQTAMIKAPPTTTYSSTTPLNTPTAPASSHTIAAGTTLRAGWWTQGPYTRLVMQGDGNLVMYRLRDGAAIWSTHTSGHPGAYAVMQTDGNFVVYNSTSESPHVALWSAHTEGNPGSYAVMQNDGNLVGYQSTGGPGKGGALWSTGTNKTAQ
ncbi:hypothetical protein ACIRU3_38450 [Streptomyces sp. NPDC101151]|uniref:hypothetical protein n=1 Tax=Streptomyces sp. NPDC101151 TaxID=3366115 RepID=UPI0038056468